MYGLQPSPQYPTEEMSTLSRNGFPSYRFPASATSSPQNFRNSGSLKSGCQISPSLSVGLFARRAPELGYQAGSGSWLEYGIRRSARVCLCARASSRARSTISQRNLPGSGSMASQYHRQYETDVSGKSGFVEACGIFATGPTSDHFSGGFVAWPLNL